MTYALFAALIFITAYGNAMNKRTYRRAAMIAEGKDVPEMSTFYKKAGNVVFGGGLIGMIVWFVWFTLGNPLAMFATQ